VVVVLFYLRIGSLQLGRLNSSKDFHGANKQTRSKTGKKKIQEKSQGDKYAFAVKSMPWVIVSIVFIVVGVLLNAYPELLPNIGYAWWVPVSLGVVIMGINMKKPGD